MIIKTESHNSPNAVELDRLPAGGTWVTLRKNITTTERQAEDSDAPQTIYIADEVAFLLPPDREEETAETILAGFRDWWIYGTHWTPRAVTPSIEEQLASLNEIAAAIIERGLL